MFLCLIINSASLVGVASIALRLCWFGEIFLHYKDIANCFTLPNVIIVFKFMLLQRNISKFLEYKKAGKRFYVDAPNSKNYPNPFFLLHAVNYLDIDQVWSCYSKDVFDFF